jgi:hypothetical protein
MVGLRGHHRLLDTRQDLPTGHVASVLIPQLLGHSRVLGCRFCRSGSLARVDIATITAGLQPPITSESSFAVYLSYAPRIALTPRQAI